MSAPRKRARTPPLAIDPSLEGQRASGPASFAIYGTNPVGPLIDQSQPAPKRRVPAAFQVNASLERAHTAYEAPLQVYGWPAGMGTAAAAAGSGPGTLAANPLFGLPPLHGSASFIPASIRGPADAYQLSGNPPYLEASVLEKALAFRTADAGTSADAHRHLAEPPRLPTPPPLPPAREAQASGSGSGSGKQAVEGDTPANVARTSSTAETRETSEEAEPLETTSAFTYPPDAFDNTAGAFPERADFDLAIEAYMHKLHPIKRNKALMPRDLHDTVLEILRKPLDTKLGDPQLRFWVRQRFRLMHGPDGLDCVLHEGKRVALRDEIYDVLAAAHDSSQHGGRDKTYITLRERWSYIPKETVTSFIKLCPTCNGKRVTDKQAARDRAPKKHRSKGDGDELPALPGAQQESAATSIAPELYGLPENLVQAFASYPAHVDAGQDVQSDTANLVPLPTPIESAPEAALASEAAAAPADSLEATVYANFVTAAAEAAAQAAKQG